MPKRAAHATLERERTRSRIVDDEPAPPAALEECLGVLPLGDDDDLATFDLFRPDGVVSAIDVEGLPDEDAVALGCDGIVCYGSSKVVLWIVWYQLKLREKLILVSPGPKQNRPRWLFPVYLDRRDPRRSAWIAPRELIAHASCSGPKRGR